MRACANFRWGRKNWYLCPWPSIRGTAVTLGLIFLTLVVFDRWILAGFERRGLVSFDGWRRHNETMQLNHKRKEQIVKFASPSWPGDVGVLGWSGHPVTKERTKSHRLLVMGDSFVWGSAYLSLNHTWWRQLAVELQRRGYNNLEVIAAGASGMSNHDELDLARLIVPEFKPDLMIWGYVTNDPDEHVVKQILQSQNDPPLPKIVRAGLRRLTPRLYSLFTKMRSDKLVSRYAGPEYGYEYYDWLPRILEGENFELYKKTVSAVGQFGKETDTPILMVTLPEAPIADRFQYSYDKVLPLWREAGIPIQDNLPLFVERFPNVDSTGPQALVWGINPGDSHPGPRASSQLAQLTADRLEKDFAALLGPKSEKLPEIRINDWLPFDLDVKQHDGEGQFSLTYPSSDAFMATMPLETPTALVALEYPVALEEIQLSGKSLKSGRVWVSTYDPVGHYDLQEWKDLGKVDGTGLHWKIPSEMADRKVSVILFQAEFSGGDRNLELKLDRNKDQHAAKEGRPQP